MKFSYVQHNHSVCLCVYHFVTCTKRRKEELTNDITVDLFREVMPDHVHLMIQAPVTFSPSYIAKLVKGCSSRMIKKQFPTFSGWSTGYFISATGRTAADAVKAYIENQR